LFQKKTNFPKLNAQLEQVIPKKFDNWANNMNEWASLLLQSCYSVSELIALSLGLNKNALTDLMKYGPHLLAPTGSDLEKYGDLNHVLAGYHYDLSFLTIHGKSRFPGLYVWLRDGTKILVKVPDGCLLLQAGKQLEWLTGGKIIAGFHEVIVSKETQETIKKRKEEGKCLWRISSTLFSHISSDEYLYPLGDLSSKETDKLYPKTLAGDQVEEELRIIKLDN